MKVNRLLVLAAGLSLVPATVGAALAFSPVLVPATSGSVGVIAPTFDVDVNLANHDGEIPADGAFHRVDDITVIAHDDTYSYTLTTLEVVFNGSQLPPSPPALLQCGTWTYGVDGSTANPVTGIGFTFPGDHLNHDTGHDLHLKIASAGTQPACRVFGGIVEATFVVTG